MSAIRPAVVRFSAVVRDGVVTIPAALAEQFRHMPKVEGTINNHPFRAPLTVVDGRYELRVSQAARAYASEVGESKFALLGPEPDPVPPPDVWGALEATPNAMANWQKLTTLGQRDWLRWIDDTKNAETRARRISRMIEQLAAGKRRACCVDVNRFMLRCVAED